MPDGAIKYPHYHSHGSRNELGEFECTGASQDLTHRRCAEHNLSNLRSELARVTRVISPGALTASIAHEVNQLLSGIITKSGGMGIALSVSRCIIERHRGRLWVAPNDDPGVKFIFSIPRPPDVVASASNLDAISGPEITDV